MTLKGLDASPALGHLVRKTAGRTKLPHLDRLIQASTDEILAARRERDTVDTVLVPIWALQTLHKEAMGDIPNPDTLVKGARGNILGVGRDSDGRNTILDTQGQDAATRLDIPQAYCAVTATGSNSTSITSKVERVDVLLVAREGVADGS